MRSFLNSVDDVAEKEKEEDYRFEVTEINLSIKALLQLFITSIKPTKNIDETKKIVTVIQKYQALIVHLLQKRYVNKCCNEIKKLLCNRLQIQINRQNVSLVHYLLKCIEDYVTYFLLKSSEKSFENLLKVLQNCFEPKRNTLLLSDSDKFIITFK